MANEPNTRGPAYFTRNRQRQTKAARLLRRDMTKPEKRVWSRLRGDQLGARFRRQLSIGPYVVDFACPECRLVVEIDGGQHADNPQDEKRTAQIEMQGWLVIRFWNSDVMDNLDRVMTTIYNAMAGGGD